MSEPTALHSLTLDELAACCASYDIRLDVPLWYLDAEAVHRGVDLATILKQYLIAKLEEVSVAR